MNDYISREAAQKVLCDACGNAACPRGLIPRCSFYEKMQSIPAADVRPVVRGHWFMISYDEAGCSCCGYDRSTPFESTREAKEKWNELPPFCEMCGTDMREEVSGHE